MPKQKHILSKFTKIAFKAYKPYFFVLFFNTLVTSATTIFSAYTLSLLILILEQGDFQKAVWMGAILVGIEVILAFFGHYSRKLLAVHQVKMTEAIDRTISAKILSLPFQYLEDPYYMELKKNAQMGVNNMGAIYSLMWSITRILSSMISIFGLAAVIVSFDPILIIILVVGILLNILVMFCSMRFQVKLYKDLLPINYKYGYYLNTLMASKNCKDFRLYSIQQHLSNNLKKFSILTYKNFVKAWRKLGIFECFISTIRYVQMAIVYILVGLKTLAEHTPISAFSLTITSAISFSDCVSQIIASGSDYIRAIQYITPMIEIMAVKEIEDEGNEQLEEIKSITFSHVFFKYPKTENYILEDISFTIHKGEKISVVGLNGAGKTTIVKLLCRLYHVSSGEILINNIPIENYESKHYLEKISAVFQDYKLFLYSIRENILPKGETSEVKKICEDVGISEKIEELPKQYESALSKSYEDDGVELSGGQQQKIAIARALAKNSDLLILDEPTSALDPLAEAEIYENFNSLAKDKTAIYISHRLSSSVFCDKILVLDGGKVKNFDSHENLMKDTESLYYKLFTTQAKNYHLEKSV